MKRRRWPWAASLLLLCLLGISGASPTPSGEDLGPGMSSAYASTATTGDVVHLVYWREVATGNTEIYYRRSSNRGDTWESEVRLTNAAGSSVSASVAASGPRVYVVWSDTRDGDAEIYFKMSSDGGASWTADRRVTNAPGESLGPAIAVGQTRVHVVWCDKRDGNAEVYYVSATPDGATWSTEARLTNTPETSTSVSIVASGLTLHVAWKEFTFIAYEHSTDEGATWSAQQQLSHPPATYLRFSEYPGIAASGTMVAVVWIDNRASSSLFGDFDLYAITSSSAGASWGPEHSIGGGLTSTTVHSAVQVEASTVRVVWPTRPSPSGTDLSYLKSDDAGATWAAPVTLEHEGTLLLDRPSFSRAGSRVHIAWTTFTVADGALADPYVHYVHLDEGPDLDVYDDALDVHANVLAFGTSIAPTADVRVGEFRLVNSSPAANPDADGPSTATSIGNLAVVPIRRPRPAAAVEAAFRQCMTSAGLGVALSVPGDKAVAFIDLVGAMSRTVPAAVVVPTTLPQGVPGVGHVLACLRTGTPRGSYAQSIRVTGESGGIRTSDNLTLRLRKGWWW